MAPKKSAAPKAKAPAAAAKAKAAAPAAAKAGKKSKKEKQLTPAEVRAQKAKAAKEARVVKDTKSDKKKTEEVAKKPASKFAALFVPRPKRLGIGQDMVRNRDVTHFVRWPQYIRRQRQKQVLLRRLKVPPAINQFRYTAKESIRRAIVRLARRYKPESKLQKKKRLRADAKAKAEDPKAVRTPKRVELKKGLQRVTRLIETKRAKLVLIANDVEPLELVVWMPTLCRSLGVPYIIIKGKSNLGRMTGFKTCTCAAFVDLRSQDKAKFNKLLEAIQRKYTDKTEGKRVKWGGLRLGKKHARKMDARAKAEAK